MWGKVICYCNTAAPSLTSPIPTQGHSFALYLMYLEPKTAAKSEVLCDGLDGSWGFCNSKEFDISDPSLVQYFAPCD